MMNDQPAIYLENVSRFYGHRLGIVDMTCSVTAGTLVGLLGPNGSGKTTTIRILSCYLPPSSGIARVAGYDVFSESLKIRENLGYLPEQCPLYPDMKVIEYLRWVGALKRINHGDLDKSIYQAIEPCGIESVTHRFIGELSKGFRQRVGLASILLFKPSILILDEPTIGLDPLQVREFRLMLESLKGQHTILISSHILSEIEMICDTVLILNKGRLIGAGPPDNLQGGVTKSYRIQCKRHPAMAAMLPQLIVRMEKTELTEYTEAGDLASIRLRTGGNDPREAFYRVCVKAGFVIVEMVQEKTSLEDVFVNLIQQTESRGSNLDTQEAGS